MRKKFDKDAQHFHSLCEHLNHNEVLQWTNRRAESFFAHVKYYDKQFTSLGKETLLELSKAHINKLGDWMNESLANPSQKG